jgi:hypothetical protein
MGGSLGGVEVEYSALVTGVEMEGQWAWVGSMRGRRWCLTGTHGELARAALPPTSMIVGPESPGATGRPFLGRTDLIAHAR